MAKKVEHSRSGTVVLTANRLRDGRVVWYGAHDTWVERIADAEILAAGADASALARAQDWARREVVVDVYAVPVESDDTGVIPVTMRERVRAIGPSVRTDLAVTRS
jgi:sulfite reductase (NADPH) hemoprotein beta-component